MNVGKNMENDKLIKKWDELTDQLAFESDASKIEAIKQNLSKLIEENKIEKNRIDNENYFARDLMDYVKDRGANKEIKKAKDYFSIMKKLMPSESDYAINCFIATQKMINNISKEDEINYKNAMSEISKFMFSRMS